MVIGQKPDFFKVFLTLHAMGHMALKKVDYNPYFIR
jgi:hypothetical protein